LENLTQQVISDLDFSVYKRDAFGKQWSIFQLEWNEDLFNATYRPKFSRTEFLTIFTRDLYNKLQLQAVPIGLDIFNDEIIDKDSLSKGEQQLYATALLKALVDESGIKFPVFICDF
jgi:hypothetical protein